MEDFDAVVERMRPIIGSIIRSLNIYKNHEEFFQIGLIALWKAYMAYDPEKGTFETFAYSYIRGSILTELRKLRKTDDKETFLDEFAMISIPDVESQSFENQFQIEDLVEQFPEKLRTFFQLHYVEGRKLTEVAKHFGVSYSTVKLWKREVTERFQQMWRET